MGKALGTFLFITVLIGVCSLCAGGQTPVQQCPGFTVFASSEKVFDGDSVTFHVEITWGDPKVNPKYNWTLDRGKITGGQSTGVINVDTTGASKEGSIVATVELGGYAGYNCSLTGSKSVIVKKRVTDEPELDFLARSDSMNLAVGLNPR